MHLARRARQSVQFINEASAGTVFANAKLTRNPLKRLPLRSSPTARKEFPVVRISSITRMTSYFSSFPGSLNSSEATFSAIDRLPPSWAVAFDFVRIKHSVRSSIPISGWRNAHLINSVTRLVFPLLLEGTTTTPLFFLGKSRLKAFNKSLRCLSYNRWYSQKKHLFGSLSAFNPCA